MTTRQPRGPETDIKERFGGFDTPATLTGMLAALGTIVFLGALVTAGATALDLQTDTIDLEGNVQDVAIGSAIAGLVVVFVALFVGGWAAGRIARYNGIINGIGTALWMLLLIAAVSALGAFADTEYDVFQEVVLPDLTAQLTGDEVTTATIVAGVVLLLAIFGGGALGGAVGDAYHRRVDDALTDDTIRTGESYQKRGRYYTTEGDDEAVSDETESDKTKV